MMAEAKYKDLVAHQAEHRKLLDQLGELCKRHLQEERPRC